jgi:hypothetical protein
VQLGLIRALTRSGLLLFAAWAVSLFWQLNQAVRVSSQPFAGLWDQRIEVLSFVVLPPNVLMLVPAAACAVAATVLASDDQQLDLAILLRLCRWSANLLAVIAIVSMLNSVINDVGSQSLIADIGLRASGLIVAVSVSTLCSVVERSTPTGST